MKILDPGIFLNDWEESIESDTRYSFYNTVHWYKLQEEYYGIELKIAQLKINHTAVRIPVFERKRKFGFMEYQSSLLGTYGTILVDGKQDIEEEFIFFNVDKSKNFCFSGNPYFSENKNENDSNDFTQVLYLENLSIEDFKGNHRRFIKKAKSEYMSVSYTEELTDWQLYFDIYAKVKEERGEKSSNDYSYKLFELIYNLPTLMRKLWIVKLENKIIGGGVFFYLGNKVHHWHGAFIRKNLKLGPTYLMHATVISDAKSKNFSIYDFNPSGGHKGVAKFKSGFNPSRLYFLNYSYRKFLYKFAMKLASKVYP